MAFWEGEEEEKWGGLKRDLVLSWCSATAERSKTVKKRRSGGREEEDMIVRTDLVWSLSGNPVVICQRRK